MKKNHMRRREWTMGFYDYITDNSINHMYPKEEPEVTDQLPQCVLSCPSPSAPPTNFFPRHAVHPILLLILTELIDNSSLQTLMTYHVS